MTSSRNNSTLKDDRNTDAEKLYADAARLAKDLKGGFNADEPDEDYVATSKRTKSRKTSRRKATAVRQCSRGISTAERPAIFPSLHTDATAEEW